MIHFEDADVNRVLATADLDAPLRRAFIGLAEGRADQQPRLRIEAGGVKLSTLGAVIPDLGVAGAKVYTTIDGRFRFVITLFSTRTGEPLATFDANAVTRWRTAAVSLLAARAAGVRKAEAIAVFGTGVQGQAHLDAFSRAFPDAAVRDVGHHATPAQARAALDGADVVITATRSPTPLFDGAWLRAGAFVAAVGSSRPDTRELDDAAFARADCVIVEWREQTLREAGDLVLLGAEVAPRLRIVELGEVLAGRRRAREGDRGLVIFKSVGVGIEDVAVAGLAYRLLTGG